MNKNLAAATTNNTNGFTLIEVLFVIVIIGILGTIGFSKLADWLPNYRFKGISQELYSDMQKAKSEAVKRNRDIGIQFNTSGCPPGGGGYTIFLDRDKDQVLDAGEEVLVNKTLTSGACVSATTLGPPTVPLHYFGFNQQGVSVQGAAGDVTLAHTDISRTYTMTLTVAGAVNMK